MVLSFFEPKKAIFYENIEGAEKAPHHLTYIFDPATNRVNGKIKSKGFVYLNDIPIGNTVESFPFKSHVSMFVFAP